MKKEILKELEDIAGEDNVIVDEDILQQYSGDESWLIYKLPDVVVRVENSQQISEVIKLANRYRIPVTPRGAGTGVSGGAIPIKGGIVLSLEKMDRIVKIDPTNRVAVVQPYVINAVLKEEVMKYGLFYPPDPASFESSTIGGNVAEGAGGPSAVKYGTTRDYVLGLEVVLGSGDILRLGGEVHKDVTGYNLLGIMIGSEGTLGIFSEITLKLLPLPEYRVDMLIPFEDIINAVKLLPAIYGSSLLPVNIEFMEKRGIEAVKRFKEVPPLPDGTEALIIMGFDSNIKDEIDYIIERVGNVVIERGGMDVYVADNPQDRERVWDMRRSLHEALKDISPVIEREDIVVPITRIPEIISFIYELEETFNATIVPFGHLGDGNIHVNILKGEMEDHEWEKKKENIVSSLLKKVCELGGRITGEHGVGILKKKYLKLNITDKEIEIYRKLKNIFDPNGILNPGKIFD